MDWTKHEYCLLHKHNKLLFFTRALTIREVLRITEKKNYMIAAEDILRLTSMIVFSERGKFRNNLIFFDLRVVKVMCSVSKKKGVFTSLYPNCTFVPSPLASLLVLAGHLEVVVCLFCEDKVALWRMWSKGRGIETQE